MASPPSTRVFNRRLRRGLRASEAQFDPLRAAYLAIVRQALRGAQRAFREQAVEVVAAGKFNPPDPDEMLPSKKKLTEQVLAKTTRTRETAARAVVSAAAPGIAWDVGGVYSERLAGMAGVRALNLNVAAREIVATLIREALTEGWTVPETAAAIGRSVEEAGPAVATMLARTDLVGTQNGASIEAARLTYPDAQLMKTWLATDDERTRETHADADGQSVPLDQQFAVGDAMLDYPGDPDGPDEEVCNCRCTVIYDEHPAAVTAAAFGLDPARHDVGLVRESTVTDRYSWELTTAVPDTLEDTMTVTAVEPVATATGNEWSAVLAVEDVWTEDGRKLVAGTTRWRDLPLTLSAMVETTEGGHLGAEVAGRIDTIERVGTELRATGEFDGGEYGQEIKRMVADRTLRGVSVDLAILDYEIRDMSTDEPMDEEAAIEAYFAGEPVGFAVLDSVIGMATVCPFQAIEEATIEVTAGAARMKLLFDPYGGDEITAAMAGMVPDDPPLNWFQKVEGGEATPFTITTQGQVFGNLALWGECHIGYDQACIRPKPSPTGYAHYQLGQTITAEGEAIATGVLTMDTGHPPVGMGLTPKQVVSHYDNTGLAFADVVVKDGIFGPWVCGALRPDVPAAKVRAARAARMSGDWRKYPRGTDLAAILMVNVGGYEVPRTQAALVASAAGAEVVELTAAGIVTPEAEIEQLADDVILTEIVRIAASV